MDLSNDDVYADIQRIRNSTLKTLVPRMPKAPFLVVDNDSGKVVEVDRIAVAKFEYNGQTSYFVYLPDVGPNQQGVEWLVAVPGSNPEQFTRRAFTGDDIAELTGLLRIEFFSRIMDSTLHIFVAMMRA